MTGTSYGFSPGRSSDARRSPAWNAAVVFGLADAIAPVGFLVSRDPIYLQIFSIALKTLYFLVFFRSLRSLVSADIWLLGILTLCLVSGIAVDGLEGTFSVASALRYIAFIVSMTLTLAVLKPETFRSYAAVIGFVAATIAALHILLVFGGLVSDHYGRFFYVGGGHPNLGGEISAVATIALALSVRTRWFIAGTSLLFYSSLLMQSRAAFIIIILIAGARLFFDARKSVAPPIFFAAIGFIVPLVVGGLVLTDIGASFAGAILLVDDSFRGLDSGFVGRDIRWALGWDLFLQNFVFGGGVSLFDANESLTPHNAFLYGLAQHGFISVLFWLVLFERIVKSAKNNLPDSLYLLFGFILFVFNDRFINLNIFPFVFYVFIMKFGLAPVWEKNTRTNSGYSIGSASLSHFSSKREV